MSLIRTEKDLLTAIQIIELRQKAEGEILRIQFRETYDSIKPFNIIKNTIRDVIVSKEIKADIINSTIAFSAGIAAKKLFEMVNSGPLTKLAGNTIMMAVSNTVSGNPETVKTIGNSILGIFRRKKDPVNIPETQNES